MPENIFEKLNGKSFEEFTQFDTKFRISETTYQNHEGKDLEKIITILGEDLANYDNMHLAGMLLFETTRETILPTYLEHVEYMEGKYRDEFVNFVNAHHISLDESIRELDWCNYLYDYTSMSILVKQYLIKKDQYSHPSETPVMMYMRCAIALFYEDGLERVLQCFRELCLQRYTLASPQMFNCGKHRQQMSSCFVLGMDDDTEHILETNKRCGLISVLNGGIGVDFSNLRSSEIRDEGFAKGPVKVMKIVDATLDWGDQLGKRKGAGTATLNVWNLKIQDFINTRRKNIDHHAQVEILNTSVSFPWMYFDRYNQKGKWTLFDPKYTRELDELYGKEFEERYIRYEMDESIPKEYKIEVDARDILDSVIIVWRQSGMPYPFFRDSVNTKSNHRHIGTIRHSNLCMEITLRDSPNEINVCNLMSLSLPSYVMDEKVTFTPTSFEQVRDLYDYETLAEMSRSLVDNLNQVIDKNFYPDITHEGVNIVKSTNEYYRAIGIGISGLADCFFKLDLAYVDEYPSREFDESIFACIEFNAICQSIQQAILHGKCDAFDGSPYSQGKFQHDLWREEFEVRYGSTTVNSGEEVLVDSEPMNPVVWRQTKLYLYDGEENIIDEINPTWEDLRRVVMKHGMRNSVLTALPPTASSSRIVRNCETVELPCNNIYAINILSGAYYLVNRHMVRDLQEIGLWNEDVCQYIIHKKGKLDDLSEYLQHMGYIDGDSLLMKSLLKKVEYIERKYTVMWRYSQKESLIRNARRGKYVDQSQSANIYFEDPKDEDLIRVYLFANFLGILTLYYLRMETKKEFQGFTLDATVADQIKSMEDSKELNLSDSNNTYINPLLVDVIRYEEDDCLMCSG